MKLVPSSTGTTTAVSADDSPLRQRMLRIKSELTEKLNRDNPGEWLSWWVAEDAFELPEATIEKLRLGGLALKRFFEVANKLYYQEPWIRHRLDKKITPVYRRLNLAQPGACPVMPRPDVALDQNWQPKFVELELTVCARFDTAVMDEQYALEAEKSLIRNYARYYKTRWPGKTLALLTAPHPVWWYIVDEAIPFAARLRREGVDVVVLEGANLPHLRFDGKQLVLHDREKDPKPIHVIDRFIDIYELAELHHPGMAPILDAYLACRLESVNTFKQFLDEKDWMALFWDPCLRDRWQNELGDEHDSLLREMIPRSWIITENTQVRLADGKTIPVRELKDLAAAQRDFIVKESGTSSTASGAQSVRFLTELSATEVEHLLDSCLHQSTPYIIQQGVDSPLISFTALNPNDGNKLVTQQGARLKLSVFYVDGHMTNIKFIASNVDRAVNKRDCIEGIIRY